MPTPTSITLHRADTDNLGHFQDAGTELTVGDDLAARVITAERARDILDSHGATGHYAASAPAKPKTKKPTAKKAATKKPEAPMPAPAPTGPEPLAAPVEPAAPATEPV